MRAKHIAILWLKLLGMKDDYKFDQVKGVFSAMETSCIYNKKLLSVGFSQHYSSYEVHESKYLDFLNLVTCTAMAPVGIYNVKDNDSCLLPLMYYLRPPEQVFIF